MKAGNAMLHAITRRKMSPSRPWSPTAAAAIARFCGWSPVQLGIPNPRRTNRPLTALARRLTLIHDEGRTGRCPRVLMDERG